jgi:hypothetical protein
MFDGSVFCVLELRLALEEGGTIMRLRWTAPYASLGHVRKCTEYQ